MPPESDSMYNAPPAPSASPSDNAPLIKNVVNDAVTAAVAASNGGDGKAADAALGDGLNALAEHVAAMGVKWLEKEAAPLESAALPAAIKAIVAIASHIGINLPAVEALAAFL
jgi:hypothetical protein